MYIYSESEWELFRGAEFMTFMERITEHHTRTLMEFIAFVHDQENDVYDAVKANF